MDSENSYERLIRDVCTIFKDVTGADAVPTKEAAAIMHWARTQKWESYDFRLIMEFCISNEKEKEFFSQPGRMNLRTMFNPARGDFLIDVHSDLKRSKEIQTKQEALKSAPKRTPMMLMRCGAKIAVGDKEGYERHMSECFKNKGLCFFPKA